MEQALRMRDADEFGPLAIRPGEHGGGLLDRTAGSSTASIPSGRAVTLCGPGAEAVSMYARENTAHALITYNDRMPAEVWYGRPDMVGQYNHITAYFTRKVLPGRRPSKGISSTAITTRCFAWPTRSVK